MVLHKVSRPEVQYVDAGKAFQAFLLEMKTGNGTCTTRKRGSNAAECYNLLDAGLSEGFCNRFTNNILVRAKVGRRVYGRNHGIDRFRSTKRFAQKRAVLRITDTEPRSGSLEGRHSGGIATNNLYLTTSGQQEFCGL